MAKAATKLQTKHADGMILPTSSQKYSQIYHGVRGSQETDRWKAGFHCLLSPFFFSLTNIA